MYKNELVEKYTIKGKTWGSAAVGLALISLGQEAYHRKTFLAWMRAQQQSR